MKDKKISKKTLRIFKWIGNVLLVQLILINISAAFHAYRFTHYYSDDKVIAVPGIFIGASYFITPMFGFNAEAGYDITSCETQTK